VTQHGSRATAHVVYPAGPQVACPYAIGRHLLEHLGRRFDVVHHEWDEVTRLRPRPGDVLIGHPHPSPWTVFRRSSQVPGWRRVVVLSPYAHGTVWQVAFLDATIRRADAYLAITGPYWARRVAEGPFRHWLPRFEAVDLAVDRRDFPRVKGALAPPGKRRFLYVGNTAAPKNVGYLSEIARAMPEAEIGWLGAGEAIPGLHAHGFVDFAKSEARQLVAGYDFMLTVGSSDANPSTILEAMAWGLVPVCTPQSGYEGERGIPNVPLADPRGATAVLRALQSAPDAELEAMRAANDAELASRFTWERFLRQVDGALDSSARPALESPPLARRLRIAVATATSPTSALRPGNAVQSMRQIVGRALARQAERRGGGGASA
jgi:glycosyltransferase involved in cell wall biosynthesis